ncbi:MAG: fused MFS/spermidine synthase [Thaumarchaeota archaeon]|nr:fused MFS/spermidine synthase [Nitrososphaerota archaeon]
MTSSLVATRTLWLRVQVFVAGFAVMGLELLGSRLVTPVFGNSIWTWGSLIGVVLAGLAAGYHFGGKLADRSPTKRRFSVILFIGGVLVVLVPFIAPFVLSLSLYSSLGDEYGPLLATTLILGLQTFVLGMTSPYAVRMASQNLASIGGVAGNLYSISTIGSIVGTFGTVFVLIPLLDVRTIIFAVGFALLLVSLPWLPRKPSVIAVVFIALILSSSFVPASPQVTTSKQGGNVVYEKETPYSILDVVDTPSQRTLYLNGIPQSGMDLGNTTRLVYQYTVYFNLGIQLNPDAANVLFVGGGGFSGPKFLLATYPHVHVDVAEIDPDVIATAQKYFAVRPDPRLTIFNEDGRIYLRETDKKYDLIVLDAYAKTYVPFDLMTQEFFRLVSAHLTPNGMVISNQIGTLEGDSSRLLRAEFKTATTVFQDSAVFETVQSPLAPQILQNVELVFRQSRDQTLLSSIEQLDKNETAQISSPASSSAIPPGGYASHLYTTTLGTDDVPVLTDNYAPVETLLDPLSGKPYVIEQEFGRLYPTTPVPEEQAVLIIGLISVIGVLWLIVVSREDATRDFSGHGRNPNPLLFDRL